MIVDAPGLAGDDAAFVVLGDGSVVAERGAAGLDSPPLAHALGLVPPFRAEAVRRGGDTWAVAARAIDVVELAAPPSGQEVELVWSRGERSVRVDGEPTLVSFPELELLGAGRSAAWVVRARRLRGRLWEVEVQRM